MMIKMMWRIPAVQNTTLSLLHFKESNFNAAELRIHNAAVSSGTRSIDEHLKGYSLDRYCKKKPFLFILSQQGVLPDNDPDVPLSLAAFKLNYNRDKSVK